jgi:hypothetical protein
MKPTQATIRQRIDEILSIRLDGAQFFDVRRYVAEKEAAGEPPWTIPEAGRPVSERTLWRYIERTDKLIAESCRGSRKRLLRRHLAQRRNRYAKAVSQGDIRAALAVLTDEAKLIGLYAPVKVAPTNPDGDEQYGLSDEERAAALAAIHASVGSRGGNKDTAEQAEEDRSLLG